MNNLMIKLQAPNDFLEELEVATGEPAWMTILGLAGEGLLDLPETVRKRTLEALRDARPRKMGQAETIRSIKNLQRKLAVIMEPREAFRNLISSGGYKDPQGRLKTYRVISELLGSTRSPQTYHRWMREEFPEIATKMGCRLS